MNVRCAEKANPKKLPEGLAGGGEGVRAPSSYKYLNSFFTLSAKKTFINDW